MAKLSLLAIIFLLVYCTYLKAFSVSLLESLQDYPWNILASVDSERLLDQMGQELHEA